jgi:hypothetical protein
MYATETYFTVEAHNANVDVIDTREVRNESAAKRRAEEMFARAEVDMVTVTRVRKTEMVTRDHYENYTILELGPKSE